jgi:hypothetical protein
MKKLEAQSVRNPTAQLTRAALVRADDEARRIPWQRLQKTRKQYIDWQEFQLWVRSRGAPNCRAPIWFASLWLNVSAFPSSSHSDPSEDTLPGGTAAAIAQPFAALMRRKRRAAFAVLPP